MSFDITLFSSKRWEVCLDLLICSSKLSGLQLFGQYGRREIIVYSETWFPLLILFLKRLRLILSYGWNLIRWRSIIAIMIGGITPFFVCVFFCNLFCFWTAGFLVAQWSCKYFVLGAGVPSLHTLCRRLHRWLIYLILICSKKLLLLLLSFLRKLLLLLLLY